MERWSHGLRLEYAWRAFLCQQSVAELERWRDAFEASGWRGEKRKFWRYELERIWRDEFAEKVRRENF